MTLGAILFLGLSASVSAHITTKRWDLENRQEHFVRLAHEQVQAIQATAASTLTILRALRGLFDVSPTVERSEFRTFVRSLGAGGATQALEWIPRVPRAARRDFEQAARQEGFPGFAFTERDDQGNIGPAGDRDEYFPVYFVEPLAGNERALGFDLGSNAKRLAALNKARISGTEVATARITLVQEIGEQYGILVFVPIYRDDNLPDPAGARSSEFTGFGLGVFRIGALVASALTKRQGAEAAIDIHIFDKSAPPGSRLLYPRTSRIEDSDDLHSLFRDEVSLRFADREWVIVATPTEGSPFVVGTWTAWIVLLLGVAITGLTALCFGIVVNRSNYANRLVHQRTAELVRSNLERNQVLKKLSRTNEELESFAYVASHDLKAPLRGIDHLVTWIVEDPETHLSEESVNNAGRLRARVNRLEALLDGLLDFSKAGQVDPAIETVETRRLCEQVAEYIGAPSGMEISVASDLPTFDTVRAALETVLSNLIRNAVKHHDREAGRIDVTAKDLGEVCRFAVRDDGPGIDPVHHDRVFKIFQKLVPGNTSDSSGIGLSIVRRLVQAAGGTIHIDSEAGKRGTVIYFTWMKTWPKEGA